MPNSTTVCWRWHGTTQMYRRCSGSCSGPRRKIICPLSSVAWSGAVVEDVVEVRDSGAARVAVLVTIYGGTADQIVIPRIRETSIRMRSA